MYDRERKAPYTFEVMSRLFENYTPDSLGMGLMELNRHVIRPYDPGSTTWLCGLPDVGKTRLASGLTWARSTLYDYRNESAYLQEIYDYQQLFNASTGYQLEALVNARGFLFGEDPRDNILFTSIERVQRDVFPFLFPAEQAELEKLIQDQKEEAHVLESKVLFIPPEYYGWYNAILKRCVDLMKMVGAEGYVETPGPHGRGDAAMNHIARLHPENTYAIWINGDNEVENKGYKIRKEKAEMKVRNQKKVKKLEEKHGYYNAVKRGEIYEAGINHNAVVAWDEMFGNDVLNPLHRRLKQYFGLEAPSDNDAQQDKFIYESLAAMNDEQKALLRRYVAELPLVESPVLITDEKGEKYINPANTNERNANAAALFGRCFFPWAGFQEKNVATVRNTPDKPYPEGIPQWNPVLHHYDFVMKLKRAKKLHVLNPYYQLDKAFHELAK